MADGRSALRVEFGRGGRAQSHDTRPLAQVEERRVAYGEDNASQSSRHGEDGAACKLLAMGVHEQLILARGHVSRDECLRALGDEGDLCTRGAWIGGWVDAWVDAFGCAFVRLCENMCDRRVEGSP